MSIVASAAVSDVGVWRHFRKSLRQARGAVAVLRRCFCWFAAEWQVPEYWLPSPVGRRGPGARRCTRRPPPSACPVPFVCRATVLPPVPIRLFVDIFSQGLRPNAPPTTVGPAPAARSSLNPSDFEIRFFLLSRFLLRHHKTGTRQSRAAKDAFPARCDINITSLLHVRLYCKTSRRPVLHRRDFEIFIFPGSNHISVRPTRTKYDIIAMYNNTIIIIIV